MVQYGALEGYAERLLEQTDNVEFDANSRAWDLLGRISEIDEKLKEARAVIGAHQPNPESILRIVEGIRGFKSESLQLTPDDIDPTNVGDGVKQLLSKADEQRKAKAARVGRSMAVNVYDGQEQASLKPVTHEVVSRGRTGESRQKEQTTEVHWANVKRRVPTNILLQ